MNRAGCYDVRGRGRKIEHKQRRIHAASPPLAACRGSLRQLDSKVSYAMQTKRDSVGYRRRPELCPSFPCSARLCRICQRQSTALSASLPSPPSSHEIFAPSLTIASSKWKISPISRSSKLINLTLSPSMIAVRSTWRNWIISFLMKLMIEFRAYI